MTDEKKTSTNSAPTQTRRSFLSHALAGGAAAGTSWLGLSTTLRAQPSGPIVIGHQTELTGGFSSWGYWQDKCAQAAAKVINESGGIAGRELVLRTEDTESNPATGARKLRSLIQRGQSSFIVGSVHSGIMLAVYSNRDRTKDRLFLCRRSNRSHR